MTCAYDGDLDVGGTGKPTVTPVVTTVGVLPNTHRIKCVDRLPKPDNKELLIGDPGQ